MTTVHTPGATCKHCGALHDHHSSVKENAVPKQGDFTICIQCGGHARFDAQLNLVPLDPTDIAWLQVNQPNTWIMMQAASLMIKQRIKQN